MGTYTKGSGYKTDSMERDLKYGMMGLPTMETIKTVLSMDLGRLNGWMAVNTRASFLRMLYRERESITGRTEGGIRGIGFKGKCMDRGF
mmetsp:Transcript_10592/g.1597  ORF Transcript_10592/g.1597 Transcript_10592/m.1597 type:complete len:89 (+) Transcript_10592:387-653(+)